MSLYHVKPIACGFFVGLSNGLFAEKIQPAVMATSAAFGAGFSLTTTRNVRPATNVMLYVGGLVLGGIVGVASRAVSVANDVLNPLPTPAQSM